MALGSNLGDRVAHLEFARSRLDALPSSRILAASDVEETAPLGDRDQPPYLNQMLALETELEPHELLGRLQAIETERGRSRAEELRWESRTLDLDIVEFDDLRLSGPDLRLPHPGLADRDFWQRQIAVVRRRLATPT